MQSFSLMKWLLILILFMGCKPTKKQSGTTLKISFSKDPGTMDPRKSGDYTSSTLICLLYEGLMRCKGGEELEPGVAEKVEISRDGKSYLFTLRESKWSNGKIVTAYDFERSWKEILTPGFPSPCSYLLDPIKNATNYRHGKCFSEEVGIRAVDDFHLRVDLESPTPYFLSLTAFPLLLPAPPTDGVFNGPFEIQSIKMGSEILLRKNNRFWNEEKISLHQISISILPDESTALTLYEKGELDILGGPLNPLPSEFIPLESVNMPIDASTFCVMNTQALPFSNLQIRKAFALCVKNNEKLVNEIEEMGQIPARRTLPPSLSQLPLPLPDTDCPKKLLQAGLEELGLEGLGGVTLYYKQNRMEKKIAQTLQKIWENELGIKVRLELLDTTSLVQKLYSKNFDIAITAWIAQVHDSQNLLERFVDKEAVKNYSSWVNEEFRICLERGTHKLSSRKSSLKRAEEILEESFPVIPLYHWNFPLLVRPSVTLPPTTVSGGILFEKVAIERESLSLHH